MSTRPNTFIREGDARKIQTTLRGYEVLHDPALNKGTAFTVAERKALGIEGLVPPW